MAVAVDFMAAEGASAAADPVDLAEEGLAVATEAPDPAGMAGVVLAARGGGREATADSREDGPAALKRVDREDLAAKREDFGHRRSKGEAIDRVVSNPTTCSRASSVGAGLGN
jgi:hypothetical protein